jgi:hypothetical protein
MQEENNPIIDVEVVATPEAVEPEVSAPVEINNVEVSSNPEATQ